MYDLMKLTFPEDDLPLFLFKMCAITNRENVISFKPRQNQILLFYILDY